MKRGVPEVCRRFMKSVKYAVQACGEHSSLPRKARYASDHERTETNPVSRRLAAAGHPRFDGAIDRATACDFTNGSPALEGAGQEQCGLPSGLHSLLQK